MAEYPPHELALLIPAMSEEDYQALRDSIADQGQLRAITLHEGKVLDGVHRQRAALEVGIDPRYEQFDGEDALGFVLASNLHRRHLNTTEKAKIAALIADRMPNRLGRNQHSSRFTSKDVTLRRRRSHDTSLAAEVAKVIGVGEASVVRAQRVLREAPDVFERMDGRSLKLGTAARRLGPSLRANPPGPKRKEKDVLSLEEKRAQRHLRDVEAWKRLIAVNGAAAKMWDEREEVLGAIDRHRDPGAIEALAGQVTRTIWQLETVAERARKRMDQPARDRVTALMRAQGWPVGNQVKSSGGME